MDSWNFVESDITPDCNGSENPNQNVISRTPWFKMTANTDQTANFTRGDVMLGDPLRKQADLVLAIKQQRNLEISSFPLPGYCLISY